MVETALDVTDEAPELLSIVVVSPEIRSAIAPLPIARALVRREFFTIFVYLLSTSPLMPDLPNSSDAEKLIATSTPSGLINLVHEIFTLSWPL
jgi:hypothetical protein